VAHSKPAASEQGAQASAGKTTDRLDSHATVAIAPHSPTMASTADSVIRQIRLTHCKHHAYSDSPAPPLMSR
jgi:hypothetical protein